MLCNSHATWADLVGSLRRVSAYREREGMTPIGLWSRFQRDTRATAMWLACYGVDVNITSRVPKDPTSILAMSFIYWNDELGTTVINY